MCIFWFWKEKKKCSNPLSGSSAAAAVLTNITETVNSYLTRVSTLDGWIGLYFFIAALSLLLLHVAVSKNDLGFYLVYFFVFCFLFHFFVVVVLFLGSFRGTAVWDSKLRKPFKFCPVSEYIPTHTRAASAFPSDNLEKLPSCAALTEITTKNNAQEACSFSLSLSLFLLVGCCYSQQQQTSRSDRRTHFACCRTSRNNNMFAAVWLFNTLFSISLTHSIFFFVLDKERERERNKIYPVGSGWGCPTCFVWASACFDPNILFQTLLIFPSLRFPHDSKILSS